MTVQEAFYKVFDELKDPATEETTRPLFYGSNICEFRIAEEKRKRFKIGVRAVSNNMPVLAVWPMSQTTFEGHAVHHRALLYLTAHHDDAPEKICVTMNHWANKHGEPLVAFVSDSFSAGFVEVVGLLGKLLCADAAPAIAVSGESKREDLWGLMT